MPNESVVLPYDEVSGKTLAINSDRSINVNQVNPAAMSLSIVNAIDQTSYNLQTSSFSASTNISNDYILDNIEFNFTTTQSREIIITSFDGTQIYKDINNNIHIHLQDINTGFNASEQVTVTVSQTAGACLMDCVVKVRQGASTLTGNPVLGAGSNVGILNSSNMQVSPATTTDVNPASVPAIYKREMETASIFPMIPGTQTKLRIRQEILNEHVESAREILNVVTPLVTVGQIFKASQDNINSIYLQLESAAAENIIDDFEYAGDDVALQASWVLSGFDLALTESTIFSSNKNSTESMKLPMHRFNNWLKTTPPTDLTGATIEFDYFQDTDSSKNTMLFGIDDGSDLNIITIVVAIALKNTWQHFSIPITSFVGIADITLITDYVLSVSKTGKNGDFGYIDNLRIRPAPGSVSLELWDMGTTLPVNNGTVNYTTAGTQYTELGDRGIGGVVSASTTIDLLGGKQLYHIQEFIAGVAREIPTNNILNVGNYYSLVIKYIDTDVSVFGANTTFLKSYYNNGYAWKAEVADNLIDLIPGIAGSGAFSDIMFGILSTQDVYITELELRIFDSNNILVNSDVKTEAIFMLEDENMGMVSLANEHFLESKHARKNDKRPILLKKGGKAEIYYNANINDKAAIGIIEIRYLYEPPIING